MRNITDVLCRFLTFKTMYTKPAEKRIRAGHKHVHWSTLDDWVQILVALVSDSQAFCMRVNFEPVAV